MTAYAVTLSEGQTITVNAHYYKCDEGWVTFKTNEHKAVADFAERFVAHILAHEVGMSA